MPTTMMTWEEMPKLLRTDSNSSTIVSEGEEPCKDLSWARAEVRKTVALPPRAHSTGRELESSVPATDVEKQQDWTIHATQELSEKRNGSIIRNIRHRFMSMYRRLFFVIFLANVAVAISFSTAKNQGTIDRLAAACLGNLTAAVVIRQEHFINCLFRVFSSIPTSWPLWFRCYCAKIYSLGGVHSGCALFSVIWLMWLTGDLTNNFVTAHVVTVPTLSLSWAVVLLLVLQTVSAYPSVRQHFHNHFERTHRFAGWLSVALVWALVVCLTEDLNKPESSRKLGLLLIQSPCFWFLAIISLCLIYPWLHLRQLPVRTEVLSAHATRIFISDRRYISAPPGSFVRLSFSPLLEWHSFAAIAEPEGPKSDYSVVVSKAGDWTSSVIANPPTQVWQRGVPTCGVLHVTKLFKKIVLIATGSGIGPCLAVLKAAEVDCRVLWSTRAPRATFGDALVDDVLRTDPGAVVYDTSRGKRPDVVRMAYSLYINCEAEAVVIISNPGLTYQVVYGLETRGVPAYGAIWDS